MAMFPKQYYPENFPEKYPRSICQHTNHKFFEMRTRTVGNTVLKRIWKAFIRSKVEYLSFVKIQKIISEDNTRAKNELIEFCAQMEELNEEEKAKAIESQEIMEIDKEQINTFSIKSKVNPENDLTLCLAIYKSAGEITSPTAEE